MFKGLLYKKNTTGFVCIACFITVIAIVLGLWGVGIHTETDWMADDDPVNELRSYLNHTFSEMQAEPGQIRGDHFEICEAADRDVSAREENLKILIYIFDFYVAEILLLLKRITTNPYRMQCQGIASIIRYIHHKDGQK